tara:strand:+ start:102 stop:1076 length:975 start_codon:yes stop_codon:yes gene_type:complete
MSDTESEQIPFDPEDHRQLLELRGHTTFVNIMALLDDNGQQNVPEDEYEHFVQGGVRILRGIINTQRHYSHPERDTHFPDVDDVTILLQKIDQLQRTEGTGIDVHHNVLARLRQEAYLMSTLYLDEDDPDPGLFHIIIAKIDTILNQYPDYTPDTFPQISAPTSNNPLTAQLVDESNAFELRIDAERFVYLLEQQFSSEMKKEKSTLIINLLKTIKQVNPHNFKILEHYVEDALDILPDIDENQEHLAFLKKFDQLLTSAILQVHHDEWAQEEEAAQAPEESVSGGKPKKKKVKKRKKRTTKKNGKRTKRKPKRAKRKKTKTKK